MENKNIDGFELFEKKKRKSEDKAIDDKYQEFVDKIKKMRRTASEKLADKTVDFSVRTIDAKVRRYEINIAEKELEILRLRDQKLDFKKQLKHKKALVKLKKKKK